MLPFSLKLFGIHSGAFSFEFLEVERHYCGKSEWKQRIAQVKRGEQPCGTAAERIKEKRKGEKGVTD